MKISTKTRYGVRFLLELASHEENSSTGQKLTTQQIAKRQGISEKYLESIAAKLKKGGLVCSAKGVNGGYWLARPISKISMGEVIRLMENNYFNVHCKVNYEDCPNYKECPLAGFWDFFEKSMSTVANNLSIEDIKNFVKL